MTVPVLWNAKGPAPKPCWKTNTTNVSIRTKPTTHGRCDDIDEAKSTAYALGPVTATLAWGRVARSAGDQVLRAKPSESFASCPVKSPRIGRSMVAVRPSGAITGSTPVSGANCPLAATVRVMDRSPALSALRSNV